MEGRAAGRGGWEGMGWLGVTRCPTPDALTSLLLSVDDRPIQAIAYSQDVLFWTLVRQLAGDQQSLPPASSLEG